MKEVLKEKTTIIGIVGFLGLVLLLVLLSTKVISATDFSVAAPSWAAGIVSALGWCASDRKNDQQ